METKTENVVLMEQAREALSGKWGLAIGTIVVYYLITLGVQFIPFAGVVISLVIAAPLAVGLAIFTLSIARNKNAELGQIFEGFNKFSVSIAAYFLMIVFIFLWAILLIIPGIIAALSYSMTFFIIADEESIGAKEAMDKSKKMMDGYKWKFFCLGLRFIGWGLLCILTLGIGFLWLIPYMQVSMAKFYDDLKGAPIATDDYVGHLGAFQ